MAKQPTDWTTAVGERVYVSQLRRNGIITGIELQGAVPRYAVQFLPAAPSARQDESRSSYAWLTSQYVDLLELAPERRG
jgi:hypothetical protein